MSLPVSSVHIHRVAAVSILTIILSASPAAAQLAVLDDALRASASVADEIQQLIRQGRRTDAAQRIDDLVASMQRSGLARDPNIDRLTAAASELRNFATSPTGAAVLEALPAPQRALYRTLDQLTRNGVSLPRIVPASARRFGQEFLAGAEDPDGAIARFRQVLSSYAPIFREAQEAGKLLNDFLAAETKVFVIGPQSATSMVQDLAADLRRAGHGTFFYTMCNVTISRLCPSDLVGAMFALSDVVLISDAALTSTSAYIPVEIAASYRSQLSLGEWYMFTPAEVLWTQRGVGAGALTVTGFSIFPRLRDR